jgi:hypothetical protein
MVERARASASCSSLLSLAAAIREANASARWSQSHGEKARKVGVRGLNSDSEGGHTVR